MEAFYKLAYDISCYYAFAAFFLSYFAEHRCNPLSFLVFFAACFLAAYAEKFKKLEKAVMAVAFLLPAVTLLWEQNIWGKVVLILPWVYLVVTVIRQGYEISYLRFKRTYLVFFWIYAAVFGFFVAENPMKGEIAMITTVPYLVILLAAGIMLLQMLRFQSGSKDKKRLEKYQRKQLAIFIAISTMITAGHITEWMYVHVFHPLTQLLLGAALGFVTLLVSLMGDHRKGINNTGLMEDLKEFAEMTQENSNKILEEMEPIREMMMEANKNQGEMDWTPFFIGACVIIGIVILAVMIGGKRIKRKPVAIEDEREEYMEEIQGTDVLKKHSLRQDIVIRYYYREFMKKSETKKNKLEIADTTKDILGKFRKTKKVLPEDSADADELTEIYRKTRYSKGTVTHADANRMKNLVKGI